MKPAIGYLRVSTAGQAERGMGLTAQRRRVVEYAQAHGLALSHIVEESASGAVREGELSSVEHRPVLAELLRRAEAGDFGSLLVASLDRLSRDQIDAQLLKRWFGKHGVRVVSTAGETNGDGGPIAELIDRVVGAIHDFERKRILERMTSGKDEKKTLGRHVHGRVPYGYLSDGGVLSPDPSRTDHVRRIFADVKSGHSPGRIARALTSEQVPGPLGGAWSPNAIRRIIANDAYAGMRYGVKRAHAAIVSRRTLNEAQRALHARGTSRRV